MWFKGAPLHEIARENVKQFFCWSFLNKSKYGLLDDAELEDYADRLESRLGRKLPPGKGKAVPLNLTLDPVHMLPRPLVCNDQSDGDFGIIAVEMMPDSTISSMIEAALLVDPVSILLHLPDVAYNFTCRQPIAANEYQLKYFASTDPDVSRTLARTFFWQENIIWKHELQGRRISVVLCGRDLITDTNAVGQYIASDKSSKWKNRDWKGIGIDIIWFNELDHSQVFELRRDYAHLIKVLQQYTLISDTDPGFEQNGG
ncbi:MAG: hypothetical protein LQ350_002203 [Teloschistes chrysophthalmus]|nr:MAG: hypothetical protein LQ350_002203 [Niorma chrysophthalma]